MLFDNFLNILLDFNICFSKDMYYSNELKYRLITNKYILDFNKLEFKR